MNVLTVKPAILAKLRSICLELPEAVERETWGDPTWRVRDRIFAMQKGNVEGGTPSLWLKVHEDTRVGLLGSDPRRFFIPPYVGSKGWVGVTLTSAPPAALLTQLIRESYQLIAPKTLVGVLTSPASRRRSASRRG